MITPKPKIKNKIKKGTPKLKKKVQLSLFLSLHEVCLISNPPIDYK